MVFYIFQLALKRTLLFSSFNPRLFVWNHQIFLDLQQSLSGSQDAPSLSCLLQVGERLARYDVEKRRAIEEEEYDLAKKKKELMEELRRNIYRQLEEHDLLDVEKPPSPSARPSVYGCASS